MKKTTESAILQRMATFCSTKEYCIQDIRKKIAASGLTEEECDRIISRLCSEKFIDEQRYVSAFVKDKLKFSKWGRIKIRYELQKKGIPTGLISTSLDEINEADYKELLKKALVLKKKSTSGKSPQDIYIKLFRFAAGRGFESAIISACLKELTNISADEGYFE